MQKSYLNTLFINKLEDYNVFKKAYVENGIIIWDNGEIDISPETVYANSFEYEEKIRGIS